MEVLCFGLSLPLSEHEAIKDCVNVYCEWLSALLTPKVCVPQPITEDPNVYARKIIAHLHYLFIPRKGEGKRAPLAIVIILIKTLILQDWSFLYLELGHDQLHSYPLRFYMAVSILNFTCNQMFPFDGHLLATSTQQTTKLQIMNLTLTSRSMTSFLCYYCY
jgi:hypothetical protein